jgi:two-component sensor histidine kinase
MGWLEVVHPDDRDAVMTAWSHARETGGFDVECRIRRTDGTYLWFSTRATPVRDRRGAVREWLGTSTEIHVTRELQERQTVLVAELQHRTRNLIAVVGSLAGKTIEEAGSLDDFQQRFRDRLSALSRVQGLLSQLSAGQRVSFDRLIESELSALGASGTDGKILLDGPPGILLRSATVQTFALALHELATNALKYGALSTLGGQLIIRWHVETRDGVPCLFVDWRETGVAMPDSSDALGGGYGRQLVERALGAVLLRDVLNIVETAREGHGRIVNRRHLRRQHRLDLVAWLHALDHGKHEVDRARIDCLPLGGNISDLDENAAQEVEIIGPDRPSQ